MDIIFELLLELVLEGTVELSKSVHVPKFIRYPLIALLALLSIGVIGIIFAVGVWILGENVLLGLLFIALALLMAVMGIRKLRKAYLTRKWDGE